MRRRLVAAALLLVTTGLLAMPVPGDFRRVLPLLQPELRDKLARQAQLWRQWGTTQRRDFATRMDAWDARPPAEKQRRRAAWAAYMRLPAFERAQVDAAAMRYARLDPGARQLLRERFAQLEPVTQAGWWLGPSLGHDYARLQPLLAQVPVAEHAGLLRVLRAMTPIQRADLAVLVWRTPPHERDRLRRELVSTADAARDGWLQARLER
ncbi:DUF3106 domain-containing protein [Lysobacter humi (ex Lee et al. 2017)]